MPSHNHIVHLNFFHNRELNELYASMAIRSFASSMITIFVPIYLLKLGYSLAAVMLFYAAFSLVHVICVIPAAKISTRYGFKHSILFSIPFLMLFYILLYTLPSFHWPLSLLAFLMGTNNALFWVGYHVDFSKFSEAQNRGEQVGIVKIITQLCTVLGPLLGGLILISVGFQVLFVIVMTLLLASSIPLLQSKDIHDPLPMSLGDIFRGQSMGNHLGFCALSIEAAMTSVIWPIFIYFTILNNYASLGLITSVSILFSLIFVWMISKLSNEHSRFILRSGSLIGSLIWGLRFLVTSGFQVFVVDSWYGMTRTMIYVPFDKLNYDKANRYEIVRFTVYREMMINLVKVPVFLSILLFKDIAGTFVLGIMAAVLFLFF